MFYRTIVLIHTYMPPVTCYLQLFYISFTLNLQKKLLFSLFFRYKFIFFSSTIFFHVENLLLRKNLFIAHCHNINNI